MGPVTSTGCGVLCPSYDRPCFSCFGPAQGTNAVSLAGRFAQLGLTPDAIHRLFLTFYATAPEFTKVSRAHDAGPS